MAQLKEGTTIGGNTVWTSGNQGPESGMHADLLDGRHGSEFMLTAGGTLSGFIVLHSDPELPMHPTTKQYVDAGRLGLAVHEPCRLASTANVDFATGGLLVVDSVQTVAGDRVLLKNQTNSTQNGIYVVAAGAWARAADANTGPLMPPGTYVFIREGTVNKDTAFSLNLTGTPTLGETPLVFNMFARVETIQPGTGLSKNGTTISIANGAITDTLIGTRTVDHGVAPTVSSGSVTTLLSNLANRVKAITGSASWLDTPAATLASLATSKLDASEVVTVAAASKVLRLNSSGLLPASVTGNAATATNVEWTGILNKPSTYTATAHKASHATGGADLLTPADIGAWPTASVKDTPSAGEVPKVASTGKVNISISGNAETVTSVPWTSVTSKPSTFAPSAHASSHASGQSDPITPAAIGAVASTMLVTTASGNNGKVLVLNADYKLPVDITGNAATATLASGVAWANVTGKPATYAHAAHANEHAAGGIDAITPASIEAVSTSLVVSSPAAGKLLLLNADGKLPASITGTAVPLSHASTHAEGASDPITPAAIGASDDSHDHTTGSQIPAAGIADGAATDAKIGNRTIADGTTAVATGTLLTLLSGLANRIKASAGTGSWLDAPVTSLATLHTSKANLSGATFIGLTGVSSSDDVKFFLRSTDADNKAYITVQNSAASELSRFGFNGSDWVIGDNKVWTAGNDGSGSTLDADLLDGREGSEYMLGSSAATTATANKLLYLDANAKLPASITGDAATVGGNSPAVFANGADTEVRVNHKPFFFAGNEDWIGLAYGDTAACAYSAADFGVVITGAAKNVKLKTRIPVDGSSLYFARVGLTKKSGTSTFSVGAVPLGANFAEITADAAGVYNSFVCSGQALAAGSSMFVSGFISGYNAAAGTDVHKFDPDTRYLDLIIQANISGATGDALVVTSVELIRMPHVDAASYIGTVPTTSEGSLPVVVGGIMNRLKAISGETNWYDTPATALKSKLNLAGGTLTGALTLAADPASALQAATKQYVDSLGSAHTASGTAHAASAIVFTPSGTLTSTNTQAAIAELNTECETKIPLAGGTMTGLLTLSGDPTGSLHAVTKQYVDNIAQGLSPKQACRLATTANIALSGLLVIDSVQTVAGDRVLVKDQTTASQNGVYIVASGSWTRATDFDTSADVKPSSHMMIEAGSTNANTGWILSTDAPITLGTTSLSFLRFSGAGMIAPGTGIAKNGDTLSLQSGVCTPGTYRSVTVDTYGRITAGTAPTTLSGYGITDAVPKAGGTMTGALTLSGDPTDDLQAATKKYVEEVAFMYAAMMS